MRLNELAKVFCGRITVFEGTYDQDDGGYIKQELPADWTAFTEDKRIVTLVLPVNESTIRVYVKGCNC